MKKSLRKGFLAVLLILLVPAPSWAMGHHHHHGGSSSTDNPGNGGGSFNGNGPSNGDNQGNNNQGPVSGINGTGSSNQTNSSNFPVAPVPEPMTMSLLGNRLGWYAFKKKNVIPKITFLSFLFVLAYWPTFQWMWERWFAYDSYYSHGLLIPFVTAFLVWQKRDALKNAKASPSPWGLPLFVAGAMVHLSSLLFRVYFTSGFSMLLVLAGFVLCVWGKSVFKQVLFPALFLVFMVPLPLVSVIGMSFQLKLLSAHLATTALNVINIPAVQEGSYIRMSHATLLVEDVCSGLRSLIALLALGALFSYWMKAGPLKKAVLFFSTVPIAILSNTLRIIVLAIISEFWGTRYLTGFVHSLCGILVFVLAFVFLSQVEKLLNGCLYAK